MMKNGGPAFPGLGGMTLRDYFAAAALANSYTHADGEGPDKIAFWAYLIADSMLEERAKEVAK